MIYLDLILNLALLVALSIVSGFIEKRLPRQTRAAALLQGILFGGASILGMLHPLNLGPGLIFDGRSVMISLCALFFGPEAAAVAVVLTVACRLALGGAGALTGSLVILSSAAIGLLARLHLQPEARPPSTLSLYLLGLAVHLAMLALMFTLPGAAGLAMVARIGPPVILLYPLATILVGKILADQVEAGQGTEALRDSEAKAKRLAEENELIAEIGRIISSTLNIEEVYGRFAAKVREVIPFDRITVNTVNLKNATRTVRYVHGNALLHAKVGETLPLAFTPTEEVIRTRTSLLVDSRNLEEMRKKFFKTRSLQIGFGTAVYVPLISGNEAIGIFVLHSLTRDVYSEGDLKLAEKVANQITGAIANAELFTERNRLEEERRDLEERLHRAEKMEALGTLAGGVAHDLNNVLGVLIGYAELLREGIPAGTRSRNYVDNILSSSEKGASIINDLLTMARRGVAVSKVINLNQIISAFLSTPVYEKLQTHHPEVTVRTDLAHDLLNIKGSPIHLEKTVMNLVSNAVEAVSGKGEVVIRTENRYLDRAVRGYDQVAEGEYVVLAVSDTGRGIPAGDLGKIFEPFYTKKVMGRSGTGLGLAVVWGTVKDHSGYIDVQSKEGTGSTFTLYFPTTRELAGGDEQQIPVDQYLGQGETILVVDDVTQQREMATQMLTSLGYKVHTAAGGEEAVEYLKTTPMDLLILDMIMDPGIDGLDTYRHALAINPEQKAILVSGFSETERVKEALRLGAWTYIRKPYLRETIGLAIRNALRKTAPRKT